MRRIVIALLLVICLTLAFAAPVLAQEPPGSVPPDDASIGIDTATSTPADGQVPPVGSIPVGRR